MIHNLENKRIPIVRTQTSEETMRVVKNLVAVGCDVIELTFSIPNISTLYPEIKKEYPNVKFGLGTVTNIERAREAVLVSADFVVSPNFNLEVSDYLVKQGIVYIPGCITPTEIMTAHLAGNPVIKIFPSTLVGMDYVKTISGLFSEVKFLISGGVDESNVADWETTSYCTGIGGSYFKDLDAKSDEELQKEWAFFVK